MLKIGDWNQLKILSRSDFGLKLDGQELGQILLPNRFVTESMQVDQEIEVFLCYDSEDRLVASTEKPLAKVGEIVALKVVSLARVGAFLDWGLSKDLLLPFSEQLWDLAVGDQVVVFIYLDKSQRIAATMKIDKHLKITRPNYSPEQVVEVLIYDKTDLGFKAVVEGQYQGLLFSNEVFQRLEYGQKISAFVRRVRDDGKVDLNLMSTGHKAAAGIEEKILKVLEDNGGRFAVNDKTDPAIIYRVFGASKKKFKIALGGLYKARKILITDEGIRLVKGNDKPNFEFDESDADSTPRRSSATRGESKPRENSATRGSSEPRGKSATRESSEPRVSRVSRRPAGKSNSKPRVSAEPTSRGSSKPTSRAQLFGFDD